MAAVAFQFQQPVPRIAAGPGGARHAEDERIARLTRQMKEAAKMLEFEIAAQLRDQIKALENG